MKNPLKIQPEDWIKERKIGQISFIIQRSIIFAVIFSIVLLPFYFVINYFLSSINEGIKFSTMIIFIISTSIGNSIGEWHSLESAYKKSLKEKKSYKNQ
jgi:uncharacterized membrane protein YqgA involved in biofilm formation